MSTNRGRKNLSLEALEVRDVPTVYTLGAAADFNLFAIDDVDAFSSDVEGRVAVGDQATFTGYGIGDRLPNSNGTRDDLIVGTDLVYTNGQVFNGNIVYGTSGDLQSVGIPNGDDRQQAGVVDFAAADADLTNTANVLGGELPNGLTKIRYSNITLRGTHPTINIFYVTEAQIENARSLQLIVPNGSSVLINVEGGDLDISNIGFRFRGALPGNVLWNFRDAQTIDLSAIGWQGSLLAPNADLTFNNGQFTGTAVVNSMTGNGQFNLAPSTFEFEIPPLASLSGLVFEDLNTSGTYDAGEPGVGGVDLYLQGTDILGRTVNINLASAGNGTYTYLNVWPGSYSVRVVPPNSYSDTLLNGIPGTINALPVGTAAINRVDGIAVASADVGINYDFPLIRNSN
jgi:choice-of-anchor A domain-containing protein